MALPESRPLPAVISVYSPASVIPSSPFRVRVKVPAPNAPVAVMAELMSSVRVDPVVTFRAPAVLILAFAAMVMLPRDTASAPVKASVPPWILVRPV